MKAMELEFGSQTLNLVLDGATIVNIEKELGGKSLFGIMMSSSGGMKIPRLGEMLVILHAANTRHGVKKADMTKLYDEYIAAGGSQMSLFQDIQTLMGKAGFFELEDQGEELAQGANMEEDTSLV